MIFLLLKDEAQVLAREKGTQERERGWKGEVARFGFNHTGDGRRDGDDCKYEFLRWWDGGFHGAIDFHITISRLVGLRCKSGCDIST